MVVNGRTDAPIPCPLGKRGAGCHSLIVYKGLAKALRLDSNQAIAHWWGIDPQTVTKWRRVLGIGAITEGASQLHWEYDKEPWVIEALAKAHRKVDNPERSRKFAEARRGKARRQHVLSAMYSTRRGSHHTEEARRSVLETIGIWNLNDLATSAQICASSCRGITHQSCPWS
jgi:hypothetical protein